MSARTAASLVETYLAQLRIELTFLGASEQDELVAEIRSLLVEAAGDDPEQAAVQIERFGSPAELATGILAEKGLAGGGAMTPAEWWRLGIAAPVDIAIGLSAPVAAFFPAYLTLTAVIENHLTTAWPYAIAVLAFFVGSLAWPWYVWRPWRTGGPRVTAGMALTGIAVVRAPGFRRIVRWADLAALGLPAPKRGRISAVAMVLFAVMLVSWAAQMGFQAVAGSTPLRAIEQFAGTEAEQKLQVADLAGQMYDSLVTSGSDVGGESRVSGSAVPMYRALVLRARQEKLTSYEMDEPTWISAGAWRVRVTERTARGTHVVSLTCTLRIEVQPSEGGGIAYGQDWVICEVTGDGLVPAP